MNGQGGDVDADAGPAGPAPQALALAPTTPTPPGCWRGSLAGLCVPGDVLLLVGDLGAGKTTFAQGFGAGLGVVEPVTSPTFTLVRQYPVPLPAGSGHPGIRTMLHADVYRLDHLHEIVDLGLAELVEDGAVALVEWGDAAEPVLGDGSLEVELAAGARSRRCRRCRRCRRRCRRCCADDHRATPRCGVVGPVACGRRRDGTVAGGPVTLLAIESATDMVGVALIRDDGGAAERLHEGGRAHAELLVPSIEEVCVASGCSVNDVGCIAVDTGPGLFTGLRVGVATAKALAQALDIGLVGISSLDILAAATAERAATPGPDDDGSVEPGDRLAGVDRVDRVASVVDARRGEVFAAVYDFSLGAGTGGISSVVDPASVRHERLEPMAPDALADWLVGVAEADGPVTVVGDGAVRYRHLLSVHGSLDLRWADELSAPPPLSLARLALARLAAGLVPVGATELVPDYRRPADARINWEQRAPRTAGRQGDVVR